MSPRLLLIFASIIVYVSPNIITLCVTVAGASFSDCIINLKATDHTSPSSNQLPVYT